MVNATFTIGQKVKLKSGSPELTVIETGERTKVEWFDGLTVVSDTFPSVCLTVDMDRDPMQVGSIPTYSTTFPTTPAKER
jgi:uncharacterized protein YodC (DUF2158 family)